MCQKLSSWFEERRHYTVEDFKRQLAYHEENKSKVQNFTVMRSIITNTKTVYIDDSKGVFAIAHNMAMDENPDIVELSRVKSCRLDVKDNCHEEHYRDENNDLMSYFPPRCSFDYDFRMFIAVDHPRFDAMDFDLNISSIDGNNPMRVNEMQHIGNEICAALTNCCDSFNPQAGCMPQAGYGQQGHLQQVI